MGQTRHISIEHIVIASNQPYEKVIDALDTRLGPTVNWGAMIQQLLTTNASWEQVAQMVEANIGTSGLTLFFKVEHSPLLSLAGKTSRAAQYTVGNPLLATQMTRHMPEAALYAPLRFVVYEDEESRTFVAYDSFVSLLAQYQREEITQVARLVEQELEDLVAKATTEGET